MKTDPTLQAWIAARKRHHLSHAHVQMACELGLNPAKLDEELEREGEEAERTLRSSTAERGDGKA